MSNYFTDFDTAFKYLLSLGYTHMDLGWLTNERIIAKANEAAESNRKM